MIYPKNFEEKTGFTKIRSIIKANCISTLGKDKVDEMQFSTQSGFIEMQQNRCNEFKEICLFYPDFPVSYYFDVRKALNRLRPENTNITVEELFDLKRSLDSIKSIIQFFKASREEQFPELKKLIANINIYPYVVEKLNNLLTKHGQIKDTASPELKTIRSQIAAKNSSVSGIVTKILKAAQKEGWIEPDTNLTMRDGKMLIPIIASHKRRIKGVIYDESATGKTSFIEPLESIELNNEIRELEFAERREIIKILTQFANDIRPYIDELLTAYEFLAEIDFLRSKAIFAIDTQSNKIKISDNPNCDFREAKHPLLYLHLKSENRKIVPLDVELNNNQRVILISGPNAGGKSVCLKTVCLLQYMHQCGMLVPASDQSVLGIFNKIFLDIGDEQSIDNDLSTYSSHLYNMKYFTENSDSETLILIDEFGTGTEPLLGAAIAQAILSNLHSKNVKSIITTHYTALKNFANATEGMENGAMLFDNSQLQPLFQLQTGKPGSSFAFEIAKKIGLESQILQNAELIVGKDHIDFEKQLQNIEEEKRRLKEERKNVQLLEKKLETEINNYQKELNFTLQQRKNILAVANEQSKKILDTVNKQVENTIYEIKKAEAEKNKTREIRKEIETFKQEVNQTLKQEDEAINAKIEKLRQKELNKLNKKETKVPEKPKKEESILKTGDTVKLKETNSTAEIMAIKDNMAMLMLGNMQTFIELSRLEKISHNQAKKIEKQKSQPVVQSWKPEKSKGDFLFGLDVRGLRAEEALTKVIKYIDEAVVAEAYEIKILHGTGNGILRQIIRDYLRTHDLVKSIQDERIENGGAGISIITLDY